jgi:FKBP-type peptidyl-prolyl cis-trans isomerase FklB
LSKDIIVQSPVSITAVAVNDRKKGVPMKLRWIFPFLVGVLLASQVSGQQNLILKNQKDKMSYIMGVDIGKSLKAQAMDIDLDVLLRGIKDTVSGGKSLLTEQEIRETVALFQKEMIAKQQAVAEKNRKEREAFLVGDPKKEGIVVLPSGLKYKVIQPGIGSKPKPTDTVTVHYWATLMDGREFDSSYRRGQPESLSVNEVIPGLKEALVLMQEGAKWLLYIPPNLAYGERGLGNQIEPNSALIFEVELIAIQGKK